MIDKYKDAPRETPYVTLSLMLEAVRLLAEARRERDSARQESLDLRKALDEAQAEIERMKNPHGR